MPDVGRQSEKLEFQKMLSSPHRKNRNEQEKKNVEKKEQRKMMKKEMNEKTMENDSFMK